MNIPIFRAKKIDSYEYVEGYLSPYISYDGEIWEDNGLVILNKIWNDVEDEEYGFWYDKSNIDPSTLAIHFPDMIDSQGTKIFASLSEDGKGGDILTYKDKENERDLVCLYKYSVMDLKVISISVDNYNFKGATITNNRYNLTVKGIKWN